MRSWTPMISGVWPRWRRSRLALSLCVVVLCALLPIPALASQVIIDGGGGARRQAMTPASRTN
jgi:hypothetical protein